MFGMIALEHWKYPLQGALHGLEYTAEGTHNGLRFKCVWRVKPERIRDRIREIDERLRSGPVDPLDQWELAPGNLSEIYLRHYLAALRGTSTVQASDIGKEDGRRHGISYAASCASGVLLDSEVSAKRRVLDATVLERKQAVAAHLDDPTRVVPVEQSESEHWVQGKTTRSFWEGYLVGLSEALALVYDDDLNVIPLRQSEARARATLGTPAEFRVSVAALLTPTLVSGTGRWVQAQRFLRTLLLGAGRRVKVLRLPWNLLPNPYQQAALAAVREAALSEVAASPKATIHFVFSEIPTELASLMDELRRQYPQISYGPDRPKP